MTLSRDDSPAQNFCRFGKIPDAEIKRLNELADRLSREDRKVVVLIKK